MASKTRPLVNANNVAQPDDALLQAMGLCEIRSTDLQSALYVAERAARRDGRTAVADTLHAIAVAEQSLTQSITQALDIVKQDRSYTSG